MRILLVATLLLLVPSTLCAQEPSIASPSDENATVLAAFKVFAEKQAADYRSSFSKFVDDFIGQPKGKYIWFGKHQFSGIMIEKIPEQYAYDVRRTDSIVSPYQGVIEFPVIFIATTVHAKGDREFCDQQPLKKCLENGGRLYESDIMYKNKARRIPHVVKYEYVYQDGVWKEKTDFLTTLTMAVALLDVEKPMTPSRAPSLFGIPLPKPQP